MLRIICCLFAVSFSTNSFANDDQEPIRLEVGEQKTLDVGEYTRLAIGQPHVAGVSAAKEPGQLTVIGRSAGKTTLLVWQKGKERVPYLIHVRGEKKAEAQPTQTQLHLGRGAQTVLTIPNVTRIAIGDPEIADVKVLGNSEVLVIANSEGRTTMMIWRGKERLEYEISVLGSAATMPEITLRVGERRHLDFANMSKVGMPNRAIADVELGSKQTLTLIGKAEGETSIRALDWNNAEFEYKVTVTR